MREPIAARRPEVPARTGSAPQGWLDLARPGKGSPPARPVRALSLLGTDGGSGSGPRPWDTSPQAIDTHPADKPRTHNSQQLRKKKISAFLAGFCGLAGWTAPADAPAPRNAPGGHRGSHERHPPPQAGTGHRKHRKNIDFPEFAQRIPRFLRGHRKPVREGHGKTRHFATARFSILVKIRGFPISERQNRHFLT